MSPLVTESELRQWLPEERGCLFADESDYLRKTPSKAFGNLDRQVDRHKTRRALFRKDVNIFTNFSASGCYFECMMLAAYHEEHPEKSTQESTCWPWNYPQTELQSNRKFNAIAVIINSRVRQKRMENQIKSCRM